MDHLAHNTPLHWGYSATNTSSSWVPVPRGVKRSLSENDDCDDAYSESSSKDQCTSPGESDSCQMQSRKKRRGVIEKKRRDRINTSLTELKRLVPSAFEKQGSAKLEKAEILQLTVDHLKMIHAKGLDSYAYDPHKYAMDYHGMGYRECVAEVQRYLERIEGLDMQNPLRLRLTSHLQCCAAQRELASKQPPPPPPPPPAPPSSSTTSTWSSYGGAYPPPGSPVNQHHQHHHHQQSMHEPHFTELAPLPPPPPPPPTLPSSTSEAPSSLRLTSTATSVLAPLTTTTSMALGYSPHQYPVNTFSIPTSHHQQNYQSNAGAGGGGGAQGMKPYRPWGAEVAY